MKIQFFVHSLICLAFGFSAGAQVNLNAMSGDELSQNKDIDQIMAEADGPKPYSYINPNDVVWEKNVYEAIPLDERANLIYYFPTQETDDRKSLFTILKDAVIEKKITDVYQFDDFRNKLTTEEIKKRLYRIDTTDAGKEMLSYGMQISQEYIVETEINPSDVIEYRIRGVYYFDRNAGELKYRLIGIAPLVVDVNTKGSDAEQGIELFWIFFPSARDILYQNYAYNERNQRANNNFDYLFNSRRFSSVIYKSDNIAGESIEEYVGDNAMYQLLEAERIKENIRDFEDDLWSY